MAEVLTNEKGERYIMLDGILYKLVPAVELKRRGRPPKIVEAPKKKKGKTKKTETPAQ